MQWPINVCPTNIRLNLRVQPVDSPAFTHFTENFSHECQGLLAVGPIIDLNCDDTTLLKPIQMRLPIFVQTKKNEGHNKSTGIESNVPQRTTTSQSSQQEIILQQQQSIFKSMLGEGESMRNYIFILYFAINRFQQ